MNASEQPAPRTAWMTAMRDEALRMHRPEIAKIVHVGWAIASYVEGAGISADPSTQDVAAIVGSSEETVARAKKVLRALGVLVEKRRPNTNTAYELRQPDGYLDWDAHLHLYTDTRQAARKRKDKQKALATQHRKSAPSTDGPQPAAAQGAEPPAPGAAPEPGAERVPGPVAGLTPVPTPRGRARRPAATSAVPTQPPLLMAVPGREPPSPEEVRETLAALGVPAAMRRYGREFVMRVIAADNPTARAMPGPTELTVPCTYSYCEAPAGAPCRSTLGLRGVAHQARLDAWNLAYAHCPACTAPAGQPCTSPDGSPLTGMHGPRTALGAEMRAIADRQHHTGT
ncbi:hypothetical protein ACFUEN_29235 [Streptomyces griseorubiginosus]|uniref:zinc finger domain-containing protein n=1 Tax=Streptomyces griseorubiginosus TaxID=67304 RepID=UPI003637B7B7